MSGINTLSFSEKGWIFWKWRWKRRVSLIATERPADSVKHYFCDSYLFDSESLISLLCGGKLDSPAVFISRAKGCEKSITICNYLLSCLCASLALLLFKFLIELIFPSLTSFIHKFLSSLKWCNSIMFKQGLFYELLLLVSITTNFCSRI